MSVSTRSVDHLKTHTQKNEDRRLGEAFAERRIYERGTCNNKCLREKWKYHRQIGRSQRSSTTVNIASVIAAKGYNYEGIISWRDQWRRYETRRGESVAPTRKQHCRKPARIWNLFMTNLWRRIARTRVVHARFKDRSISTGNFFKLSLRELIIGCAISLQRDNFSGNNLLMSNCVQVRATV